MRIDFDVVDISLGRFFFIGSTFAFKPSMGVRLAWIKQREDITYTGALAGLNAFTEDTVNLLNRMRGAGLRLGSDLRMILKWGFEFYGSIFYSLLSSNVQVNDEEFLNIQGFAPADDIAKNRLRLMNTAIEMSAGLKWGTYVYKKAYLSIHVGFEQQNYMDFNQLRLLIVALTPRGISSNGNYGSFGMHGLVTGAKLFF